MTEELKVERELLSPPGDDIPEIIESIKMNRIQLAELLEETISEVNNLITGEGVVTSNIALKLQKILGVDAQFWLNREMNYRTKLIRIEQKNHYINRRRR